MSGTDNGGSNQDLPLGSYALLSATYVVGLGGFLLALHRSRRRLPERPELADVVLLGIGTHKASRLVTRDRVTAAVRSPFAEYAGPAGPAEVESEVRGSGLRRAIGELLTCPYCIGLWIATVFAAAFTLVPRLTRFLASLLVTVTISDFLQILYKAGEDALAD